MITTLHRKHYKRILFNKLNQSVLSNGMEQSRGMPEKQDF